MYRNFCIISWENSTNYQNELFSDAPFHCQNIQQGEWKLFAFQVTSRKLLCCCWKKKTHEGSLSAKSKPRAWVPGANSSWASGTQLPANRAWENNLCQTFHEILVFISGSKSRRVWAEAESLSLTLWFSSLLWGAHWSCTEGEGYTNTALQFSRAIPRTPFPSTEINGFDLAADKDAWRNLKGRAKEQGCITHLKKLVFFIKPPGQRNNYLVSCVSLLCSLVGSMQEEQGWFFISRELSKCWTKLLLQ